MTDLSDILVSPNTSVREVMARINANAKGIALVVDNEQRLLATVTDGDIRRAILAGASLHSPILTLSQNGTGKRPFTAYAGVADSELLQLMNDHGLRHVPLLNGDGKLVDLALLSDLARNSEARMRAVVMAGGRGVRLRPLTDDRPKPMLPVGNRPLLELVIERIRNAGIRRVHVSTHYRSEMIQDHFGDGRNFGVDISYTNEDQPLGTAGALGKLPETSDRVLVINGDILTGLDFRAMLHFHEDQHADATIVVREYTVEVPYGVVTTADDCVGISGITEKPIFRYLVNAGIYLLNPVVHRSVAANGHCDMPDLINRALSSGRRVVSFPAPEYWLDIGCKADYEKAQLDYAAGRV